MKRGVKRAILVAIACALVVFVLPVLADSQARIVRLSYVDGSVDIDRNSGEGFERAIVNMPMTQGTKLWTHRDGEAEVEFEDGSTVRLAPDTRLSFGELSLRSDGGKVTLVDVEDGTVYFNVKHKGDDDFRVAFAGRDVQLTKSAHFRAELNDRQLLLAVFKGELDMQGTDGTTKIKKNETVSFNLDDPAKYTLAKGVEQGQYDWWDKERDQYQSQYSYKNSTYASAGYNAPSYGWSDLNYYGSTFMLPGYGYVWRPYDVGMNWDPFGAGYWVYYPSFGYTWVSPYAWGWMPYRYGNWLYANNYGWVWRPTPGGFTTWTPRPRYANPPNSYRPPAPPVSASNPQPGRTILPVGNPRDTSIPRWTPRAVLKDGRPVPGRVGGVNPATAVRGSGDVKAGTAAGARTPTPGRPNATAPTSGGTPVRGTDTPRSASRGDSPRVAPSAPRATPSFSAPRSMPSSSGTHSGGTARPPK